MDVVRRTAINLETSVEGYDGLTKWQRSVLRAFPLAWALFEERCLQRDARPGRIRTFVQGVLLEDVGSEEVLGAFRYFQNRYFVAPHHDDRFHALCFGRDHEPANNQGISVRDRLTALQQADNASESEKAEFALLVVYRLRNNLLHGNKLDNIAGQTENFTYALRVLNHFIERSRL